jgi:hypothetical protein
MGGHATREKATETMTEQLRHSDAEPVTTPVLGDREKRMLALEREWWKYSGAKEQAIRDLFDMSATHYYQALNILIDTEAALAHDPMLVKRLRRLRTTRTRARSARRLGADI